MKKFVSICMVVLIVCTLFPVSILAQETDRDEQTQLLELACEVFPEYAAIIRSDTAVGYSLPNSTNSNEIVFTETRDISETENLSITQLASGNVIVVDAKYDYSNLEETNSSISNVGTDTIGYASFKATCTSVSGVFEYKNVGFIITQSGIGNFTSYGTVSTSGSIAIGESSVTQTRITYPLTFNYSGSNKILLRFTLYFNNSQLVAELG